MTFVIAIPSFQRANLLNNKTLKMLHDNNIDKNIIHIFVIKEEYELYLNTLDKDKYEKLIIGELGLINQRQFINNYFENGTHILNLDDDIEKVDLSLHPEYSSLFNFILFAFNKSKEIGSFIWSIYPVYNPFFRIKKDEYSTSLKYLVGAFYGTINRNTLEDIKEKFIDVKEDVERTIRYFINDGIVLRFNKVGFVTKYYNDGGLGKNRLGLSKDAVENLMWNFPEYGKIKIRKSGIYEFELKRLFPSKPSLEKMESKLALPCVEILATVDKDIFSNLYEMLNKTKTKICSGRSSRRGFGKCRMEQYGSIKARFTGKVGLSYASKKKFHIYDEIIKIGEQICPFKFDSIQLNHNVTCPKHKDTNNSGNSLLVSFGEYTGSNIIINEISYCSKYTPIIFNGTENEHYNSNDLIGNKYSLIFFNNSTF